MFRTIPRLFSIAAMFAVLAAGQQVTGNVSGTVRDTSGAIITGVSIKLVSDNTGQTRSTTSDRNGDFEFNAIVETSRCLQSLRTITVPVAPVLSS